MRTYPASFRLACLAALALLGGCSDSAVVVEEDPDSGVRPLDEQSVFEWRWSCSDAAFGLDFPESETFVVPNGTRFMLITASLNATLAGPYANMADSPGATTGGYAPGHRYAHDRADYYFFFNGTNHITKGVALEAGAVEGPTLWNYSAPLEGTWTAYTFCHGINMHVETRIVAYVERPVTPESAA